MKTFGKILLAILAVALLVVVIVFGPLAPLWALNTLLPYIIPTMMQIPYNFYTWAAVVLLNLTLFREKTANLVNAIRDRKE